MKECWCEDPSSRLTMARIRKILITIETVIRSTTVDLVNMNCKLDNDVICTSEQISKLEERETISRDHTAPVEVAES